MRKTNTGFTLIELLITITIGAILLSLAVPAFQDTIHNNRLTTQANQLITAINMARSESIKRRANVTICPSADQATCSTGAAWQGGWIVRNDTNNEMLRSFDAMSGMTVVTGAPNQITYNQRGSLNGNNDVNMTLCAGAGRSGREIHITVSGRPATTRLEAC